MKITVMKKIKKLIRPYLLMCFLGFIADCKAQTAFTSGNIVVCRVGNGSGTLTSAAWPVFLDEFTPNGTLVQSIPMPTLASGLNKFRTFSGNTGFLGQLTLSTNGQYLGLAGFNAPVGTTGISTSTTATWPRVIGLINYDGTINTS